MPQAPSAFMRTWCEIPARPWRYSPNTGSYQHAPNIGLEPSRLTALCDDVAVARGSNRTFGGQEYRLIEIRKELTADVTDIRKLNYRDPL